MQSAAAKAANAKRAASKISARLTATDAQRIQSATAQQNNGKVQGGSFASRAQVFALIEYVAYLCICDKPSVGFTFCRYEVKFWTVIFVISVSKQYIQVLGLPLQK